MMTKHNKIISIVEIDPKKEAAKIQLKKRLQLTLPLNALENEKDMHYLNVDQGTLLKDWQPSNLSNYMHNTQVVDLPISIDRKRGKPIKAVHDLPNQFLNRRLSGGDATNHKNSSGIHIVQTKSR